MLSVLAGLPGMAQPWDIRRFAQTAIFFNAPEDVLKRLAPPNPFLKPNVIGKDGLVWSSTNRMLEFGPLDDVVMGGVSQSSFAITPAGIGKFQGEVSTENNGGFAGVRSKALTPALQLGSFQGLKLRVKGDGSRYKFIVRDSYDWNGCAALHSLRHSHDTQREPPSRCAELHGLSLSILHPRSGKSACYPSTISFQRSSQSRSPASVSIRTLSTRSRLP